MLTLVHGAAQVDLYPEIGGSLGRWSIGTQDLLRRASAKAIDDVEPFGMASFPLVPYSNRIGAARFHWQGAQIALRPNFAPEPHAIHGVGWKRAWTVTEQSKCTAVMVLHHRGDTDWPWPFLARQRITLGEDHLHLALTAWNLADQAVPLGFGHHPYFDTTGASLRFTAEAMWTNGKDNLPDAEQIPAGNFDFSAGARVQGRRLDNCYAGLTEPATISWIDRSYSLRIEQTPDLPGAVVCIPEPPGAFCFEPVPHVNDALNRMPALGAMPVVALGEAFTAAIVLRAVPAQDAGGASESR